MKNLVKASEQHLATLEKVAHNSDRRGFLKLAGLTVAIVAAGGVVAGCSDDATTNPTTGAVDLGSGDVGILNYAYALEQLEAAFYTKVVGSFYTGATDAEKSILSDIMAHEVAHRDFFKSAISANGGTPIADLTVNFSSIDFTSRASVLGTAKVFEDLGVSAYNGAGKLLVNANFLLLAGKIVSVEARHAAAIRDLLSPKSNSFAGDDVVATATGLDGAAMPSAVLTAAAPYITTTITANNLPTS